MFLRVACMCRCLVACRVSPAQKRLLVRLVKKGVKPKPVTLAIGDGANDVGMILEAQVSVQLSHLLH
jgi:phospholipid-transporting ATPase